MRERQSSHLISSFAHHSITGHCSFALEKRISYFPAGNLSCTRKSFY